MSWRNDPGLHVLHDHAFAGTCQAFLGHLRREFAYRDAEFILLGRALVIPPSSSFQSAPQTAWPIRDGHALSCCLPLRHEPRAPLSSRLARRDVSYQFEPLVTFFAVHPFVMGVAPPSKPLNRPDCRAPPLDMLRPRSIAINPRNCRNFDRVKHNADRSASHPVLGSDKLVINLHTVLEGKRESHARVGVGSRSKWRY